MGDAFAQAKWQKNLAELEAAAAATAEKPAIPASEDFLVAATIHDVSVKLAPNCNAAAVSAEGAVTGVTLTCGFERRAIVTLLVSLTSTDTERYPVWNGKAIALEPLPLQFRVREQIILPAPPQPK